MHRGERKIFLKHQIVSKYCRCKNTSFYRTPPVAPPVTLKLDPNHPKAFVLFASMEALQNDENCFLVQFKRSFHSQDV